MTKNKDENIVIAFIVGVFNAMLGALATGSASVDKVVRIIVLTSITLALLGWLVPMGIEGGMVIFHIIMDIVLTPFHTAVDIVHSVMGWMQNLGGEVMVPATEAVEAATDIPAS